jgi:CBS domain-containing protein
MSDSSSLKSEETTPYLTHPSFFGELLKRRVDSFLHPDGKIYVAGRDEAVVDVWRGMIARNVFSVPVIQPRTSKYYGMLDIADIVLFIIQTFGETVRTFDKDFFTRHLNTEYFRSLKVKNVMVYPISRRNPFHPMPRTFTLFSAVEALAREKGLHRVPILDSGKLVNLLTQTQILAFIANHVDKLGSIKNKPVLECMSSRVLTVFEHDIAIRAFEKMIEYNVCGLAVVDGEGRCVETISLRDLKVIQHDAMLFTRLYYKVKELLQHIKLDAQERQNRPPELVSIRPTDTLEIAIKRIHQNRIHHLFVLNQRGAPIGILSIKDILFQIVENPGKLVVSGH